MAIVNSAKSSQSPHIILHITESISRYSTWYMLCHSVIAFDYELFNLINSDEFGIW